MKQSQLQNHEGKAANSRLGNIPPHFQLFPRSVFHVKPQLIFQAVIHIEASKSHKHIQTNCPNSNTPTFHVKHQASATNRGKATHPKRYLLQLNHPIMFHVKPLFHIPHSPNLRFTWNIRKLSNIRKAQHWITDFQQFSIHPYKHAPHIPQNKLYDFKHVRYQHFLQNRTVVAEDSIYKHYQCFTWNGEADSASPHMISLWTLRKTKIDGMFFLIFHLLG